MIILIICIGCIVCIVIDTVLHHRREVDAAKRDSELIKERDALMHENFGLHVQLESLKENLQHPGVVYSYLLKGRINLSRVDALHYAGVTAIDGWRQLIAWNDETQYPDYEVIRQRTSLG